MIRISLKWLSRLRAYMNHCIILAFTSNPTQAKLCRGKSALVNSHFKPSKVVSTSQILRVSLAEPMHVIGNAGPFHSEFVKSCHRLPSRG